MLLPPSAMGLLKRLFVAELVAVALVVGASCKEDDPPAPPKEQVPGTFADGRCWRDDPTVYFNSSLDPGLENVMNNFPGWGNAADRLAAWQKAIKDWNDALTKNGMKRQIKDGGEKKALW